jgi:glycosyltransferase involved in cell wall biosynthesis
MNVVILCDTAFVNGGAAKVALDGARSLAKAGHRVNLVCGVGPVEDSLKDQPNLLVHCIGQFDVLEDPNRLRGLAFGLWNPRSYEGVGEILSSLNPEDTIVHVHSWTKALSSSAVRAALDRNFQVVFTMHDFLLACPTGTLFLQNKLQKCALRPMSAACICTNCDVRSYFHKVLRLGRSMVQNHFGHIVSGVRHFIAPSQLVQNLLQQYLPEDAVFHSVPNPIEVDRDSPAPVSDNDTFVFLGRLTPEKGAELFARAAAAEQVRCQFIGDGMSQPSVAQANPNAVFSGWMSHRDGVKALRAARALVFPSLWYEVSPLVVLEAAGNGVPCIVADTCGARESVVDGVTGLYFRSGDESDLRAKIAILKDPQVAARLGEAAYRRFWAPPGRSLEMHCQRLESTYREILASKYGVVHQSALV